MKVTDRSAEATGTTHLFTSMPQSTRKMPVVAARKAQRSIAAWRTLSLSASNDS